MKKPLLSEKQHREFLDIMLKCIRGYHLNKHEVPKDDVERVEDSLNIAKSVGYVGLYREYITSFRNEGINPNPSLRKFTIRVDRRYN